MKTYGKQNILSREWLNLKERFSPSRHTITLCESNGLKVYTPSLNKARVGIASAFVVGCLVTPFNSWAIPLIIKWGIK